MTAKTWNMHAICQMDIHSSSPIVGIGTLQVTYSPEEALNMAAWLLRYSGKTLTDFNQMFAAVLKSDGSETHDED